MYYEHQKHTGEFPIIGVNTFLSKNGSPTIVPKEVIRSTTEEKEFQITALNAFKKRHEKESEEHRRPSVCSRWLLPTEIFSPS